MICDRCGKEYKGAFNTIINLDYEMSGKGKPIRMDLCLECRKYIKEILNERN